MVGCVFFEEIFNGLDSKDELPGHTLIKLCDTPHLTLLNVWIYFRVVCFREHHQRFESLHQYGLSLTSFVNLKSRVSSAGCGSARRVTRKRAHGNAPTFLHITLFPSSFSHTCSSLQLCRSKNPPKWRTVCAACKRQRDRKWPSLAHVTGMIERSPVGHSSMNAHRELLEASGREFRHWAGRLRRRDCLAESANFGTSPCRLSLQPRPFFFFFANDGTIHPSPRHSKSVKCLWACVWAAYHLLLPPAAIKATGFSPKCHPKIPLHLPLSPIFSKR